MFYALILILTGEPTLRLFVFLLLLLPVEVGLPLPVAPVAPVSVAIPVVPVVPVPVPVPAVPVSVLAIPVPGGGADVNTGERAGSTMLRVAGVAFPPPHLCLAGHASAGWFPRIHAESTRDLANRAHNLFDRATGTGLA